MSPDLRTYHMRDSCRRGHHLVFSANTLLDKPLYCTLAPQRNKGESQCLYNWDRHKRWLWQRDCVHSCEDIRMSHTSQTCCNTRPHLGENKTAPDTSCSDLQCAACGQDNAHKFHRGPPPHSRVGSHPRCRTCLSMSQSQHQLDAPSPHRKACWHSCFGKHSTSGNQSPRTSDRHKEYGWHCVAARTSLGTQARCSNSGFCSKCPHQHQCKQRPCSDALHQRAWQLCRRGMYSYCSWLAPHNTHCCDKLAPCI
mmetsp:Transcript_50342/g.119672  ORF Transcript_50342/g.119672 Transcript_50342/m.119672 type:complete len:253 (+) Transcript_50342:1537-2295(+)